MRRVNNYVKRNVARLRNDQHQPPRATPIDAFARYGLDVPIGIGGHTTIVNGAPRFGRDENYERYLVGAIPQIQLIDRQGRIRHIMVGFDESNEAGLAKIIEALLKEQ